jgi:hypothetical protein
VSQDRSDVFLMLWQSNDLLSTLDFHHKAKQAGIDCPSQWGSDELCDFVMVREDVLERRASHWTSPSPVKEGSGTTWFSSDRLW